MKKSIRIVVNGQEYDSVDHMPPEIREQYLRTISSLRGSDADGVPDIVQNPGGEVATTEFITFNGRKYKSREELPPEVRELIDRLPKLIKPVEDKASLDVSTTIVVNGQEYDSVEHMPPEVRQQYHQAIASLRDSDAAGAPDIVQTPGASVDATVTEFITFNGRKYKSREELPPEARELIDRLPKLVKPGEDKTSLEVNTTEVTTNTVWGNDQSSNTNSGFTRILLWLLSTAVLVLLFFWLRGIKPSQLFGH